MEQVLLDQTVDTDYGQFDLVWSDDGIGFDGDFDRYFHDQVNGLAGAAAGSGVYVNLARRSGGSRVRIVLLGGKPPQPSAEFEDVVEVSLTVPEGAEVRWASWAVETSGALREIAAGSYRLRVSGRGRDAARADELADRVLDEYVLELWPAPPAPDAVVRVGSEDAKYWHREVGGRQ